MDGPSKENSTNISDIRERTVRLETQMVHVYQRFSVMADDLKVLRTKARDGIKEIRSGLVEERMIRQRDLARERLQREAMLTRSLLWVMAIIGPILGERLITLLMSKL